METGSPSCLFSSSCGGTGGITMLGLVGLTGGRSSILSAHSMFSFTLSRASRSALSTRLKKASVFLNRLLFASKETQIVRSSSGFFFKSFYSFMELDCKNSAPLQSLQYHMVGFLEEGRPQPRFLQIVAACPHFSFIMH